MHYWEKILDEIKGKKSGHFWYLYTNLHESNTMHEQPEDPHPKSTPKKHQRTHPRKHYPLDQSNHYTYLTQREAECIFLLSQGCTMKAAGEKLNLSHRTVEFYINNVKEKMNVRTKKQMLHAIQATGFLDEFSLYMFEQSPNSHHHKIVKH